MTRDGAEEAPDASPDIIADIRALGQLSAGTVTLEEARYRGDVTVLGKAEMLGRVFPGKPHFVEDHF